MVHFSVFGGQDGQLSPDGSVYINIFGGATLTRPPFASRMAELRRPNGEQQSARYFFFSLFGGTTIKWPTLAEEYLALLDALRGGSFSLDDWDCFIGRLGVERAFRIASFSIFGGLSTDALPSEDQELDDLTLQRHTGTIPESGVERLMLAIGHSGSQRLAAVRQAVAAMLTGGD